MSRRGSGPDQPAHDPKDPAGFLTEPLGPTGAEERRKADLDHLKRLRELRQRKLLRAGLVGLLLVALIVFVLQNAQPVEVHLLFLSGRPLLIWVIVACAALGGIVGYVLGRPSKATRLHGEAGTKGRSRRP
ncbi:MAG TPA: LapA family protein [Actinomycetota bacterium]|jgi:uncharacterized integral membrane protein